MTQPVSGGKYCSDFQELKFLLKPVDVVILNILVPAAF